VRFAAPDPEYWATLVKAYFKSMDEGKPLGVAVIAALVDVFSLSASLLSTNRVFFKRVCIEVGMVGYRPITKHSDMENYQGQRFRFKHISWLEVLKCWRLESL